MAKSFFNALLHYFITNVESLGVDCCLGISNSIFAGQFVRKGASHYCMKAQPKKVIDRHIVFVHMYSMYGTYHTTIDTWSYVVRMYCTYIATNNGPGALAIL